jgi:sec-independent protein translocase protein TatA
MILGEIFGVDGVIVVLVVVVLLFGGSFIPKFAKNLGSAKTEFEKGLKESSAPAKDADKKTDAETTTPDTSA